MAQKLANLTITQNSTRSGGREFDRYMRKSLFERPSRFGISKLAPVALAVILTTGVLATNSNAKNEITTQKQPIVQVDEKNTARDIFTGIFVAGAIAIASYAGYKGYTFIFGKEPTNEQKNPSQATQRR